MTGKCFPPDKISAYDLPPLDSVCSSIACLSGGGICGSAIGTLLLGTKTGALTKLLGSNVNTWLLVRLLSPAVLACTLCGSAVVAELLFELRSFTLTFSAPRSARLCENRHTSPKRQIPFAKYRHRIVDEARELAPVLLTDPVNEAARCSESLAGRGAN